MRYRTCQQIAVILAGLVIAPSGLEAQSCPGRRDPITTKVVGGFQAKLAYWPSMAALRNKDPVEKGVRYFCGGSVVERNWVLTAAHCAAKITKAADGRFTTEVVLGKDDIETVTPADVYQIAEVTPHESYFLQPEDGSDVALIKLASPWNGATARLPLDDSADPADGRAYAAGFGDVQGGKTVSWRAARNGDRIWAYTTTLQEVPLPIVAAATCQKAYRDHGNPKFRRAAIGTEQICAGYPRGSQDTCNGDSGGPLVVYDKNNCPIQIGVVSWGDGCAKAGAYGVYSRVSAYKSWMLWHAPEIETAGVRNVEKPSVVAIANQTMAAALKQLEDTIPSAKGRIRVGIAGGDRVRLNSTMQFTANSDVSGRLILLDVNASGEIVQIFPNRYVAAGETRLVTKGKSVLIPDPANPAYQFKGFQATAPTGYGRLIAIVAPLGVPVSDIVEEPTRMAKGFAGQEAPVSYLSNLFDQLISAVAYSGDADAQNWALGEATYEIVP